MRILPAALEKTVAHLSRLPGIGERTAMRLGFFILSQPETFARSLSTSLLELIEHVRFCEDCHMISEDPVCDTCSDPSRRDGTLCVVAGIADVLAFERTSAYRGRYHVLHGVLSPLRGIGPDQLRLANLSERITRDGITEVIVATNTDVEGEATALYLARRLGAADVSVTRLATGMPMGGELEYLDQNTLTRALEGRREM